MAKWDNVQHGNPATYRSTYYACRCDDCRIANSVLATKERAARRAKGLADGDERHGTVSGYRTWGCRCAPCTKAHSAKSRESYAKRRANARSENDRV